MRLLILALALTAALTGCGTTSTNSASATKPLHAKPQLISREIAMTTYGSTIAYDRTEHWAWHLPSKGKDQWQDSTAHSVRLLSGALISSDNHLGL